MAGNGCFLLKDCEELQIQMRNEPDYKRRISKSLFQVKTRLPLLYFLFLVWRFVSFVLYVVHSSDCFFTYKHLSYLCSNSTMFLYPQELELSWQISCVINSIVCIAVLPLMSTFQGYWYTLKQLSHFPRFWSLQGQLLVTVAYTAIVSVLHNVPDTEVSVALEVGFILGPIFTTMVACLWNLAPYPTQHTLSPHMYLVYRCTILMYYVENLYVFVLVSVHIAFGINGVKGNDLSTLHPSVHAAVIIVHAGEASFYHDISKIFWNKLFDDKRNLLKLDRI